MGIYTEIQGFHLFSFIYQIYIKFPKSLLVLNRYNLKQYSVVMKLNYQKEV